MPDGCSRRAMARSLSLAVAGGAGSRILGANNDIRIGIIGLGSTVKIGGKGKQDLKAFARVPGVRVTAVCDVDRNILETESGKLKDAGAAVETYSDFRKLLDSRNVDAVVVTTPNHWHAVMTVMACQAGKDVFVQKPSTHNISEGRRMARAAERYRRIVMCPHGSREPQGILEAIEFARGGKLGRLRYIHGVNYKPRMSIGKVAGPQAVPAGIDYDLWCGPAPLKPLRREFLHYDWHWDWDYGNGDLGNMGVHYLDGCRIAAGHSALPERVLTVGFRAGYDDDGQTPNTLIGLLDYRPAPILFEVRGLPQNRAFRDGNWERNSALSMDQYHGIRIGLVVHCEDGFIANNRAFDNRGRLLKTFEAGNRPAYEHFADAVRRRKLAPPASDALESHYSASIAHMLHISYRLGRQAPPGEVRERLRGDKELSASFERLLDHVYANRIDLGREPLILGASLRLDPRRERFTGDFSAEANALSTRDYRRPFVLPGEG